MSANTSHNAEDVLLVTTAPDEDLSHLNDEEARGVAAAPYQLQLSIHAGKEDVDEAEEAVESARRPEESSVAPVVVEPRAMQIDEKILADMKYLYTNTRYFLIKSTNYENVQIAKAKNVWSTPRLNEIRLEKSYKECANVILVFSVNDSGRFQGIARLASQCIYEPEAQVDWVLPPYLSAKSLAGVFKLDWITKY